jgi:hypothetical protein
MSALDTRARREAAASELLGMDVRDIPKAPLAVVAIYLALTLDGEERFSSARARLAREWDTLYRQNIIETPCPPALLRACEAIR